MVHRHGISRRQRHRSSSSSFVRQALSTRSNGMPQIPGMWYDETRNRYFRITHENPAPKPKPIFKPVRRKISFFQLVRSTELGQDTVERSSLPAWLLAKTAPQHVRLPDRLPPIDGEASPKGALAVIHPPSQVGLYSFPDGRCVDGVDFEGYELLNATWCERRAALLVTAKSVGCGGWPRSQYTSLVCSFGDRDEDAPPLILIEALQEGPYSVALEDGYKAVGCETTTCYRGMGGTRRTLTHTDQSAALATALDGEGGVFAGTRMGNVYRWDTRVGDAPVWNCSGEKHCSIADLKLAESGSMIYVSRMRNKRANLGGWDLRMEGCAVEFTGHLNSYKRLKFGICEGGGVLMGGGEDGFVRVWDLKKGGACIGERRMGGIVKDVELVGGQGRRGWMSTQNGVYTLQAERSGR